MLDTLLLKQLNDPDPVVRRKAVVALGKSQNEEALPYLATVFKKDRDPEIRQLARKAGLYIKQQSVDVFATSPISGGSAGASKSKSGDDDELMSSAGTYYEELELPEPEPVVEVSEANQQRAKGLLQQALDMNLRGNNDKAIHYFQNALKRNPNLKTDSYALSMASTITGIASGERAIETLMADAKKKRGGRGQREAREAAPGGSGWGSAVIDLLIFGLVTAATLGVSIYIFFAVFIPSDPEAMAQRIANAQNSSGVEGDPVSILALFLPPDVMTHLLTNYSPTLVITYSVIFGIACVAFIFIYYLFIHFISARMLEGNGSLARLISTATLAQAFMVPVFIVGMFLVISFLIQNPQFERGFTRLLLLPGIGYLAVLSWRISVAYQFSRQLGYRAILFATIGLIVFFGVAAFVVYSISTNSIGVR
jgi:hypothetical protein